MSPMSPASCQCSLACPPRAGNPPSFSSRFSFPDDLLSHEHFHHVAYVSYLRLSPNALSWALRTYKSNHNHNHNRKREPGSKSEWFQTLHHEASPSPPCQVLPGSQELRRQSRLSEAASSSPDRRCHRNKVRGTDVTIQEAPGQGGI